MIYGQKKSSIHKIVKNEKEIHVSFSVIPQTAEVMGTVHDNCFVKMEKALKLYNKILSERTHIPIFHYSILLLKLFSFIISHCS